MAGHLGQETVTTLNVTVWRVDVERGLILVKGSVPGTEGTYVKLRDAVKGTLPADAPKPGAFRTAGGQPTPVEAAAEEAEAAPAQEADAEAQVTEAPAEDAGSWGSSVMKLDVIKLDGGKGGSIELPDDIFGIEEIRADILQRCVNWQLAKRRSGNHKIQVRNEVSRTGKKMYRQKGTGGARHGSRRAAQFVGGAKAHGPVVRSHAFDLPKKVRALALRHALSSKAKDGSLIVVDNVTLKDPKTARAARAAGQDRRHPRPGDRRGRGGQQLQAGRPQHPQRGRAAERRPQRL
jgi:hypothetical protein